MVKGKTTQNGKGAQSQNKRPAQNGKVVTRVVKSAAAQRPKVGAKTNGVKARAVTVSAKPKPTNNKAIIKPGAKVNKRAPKQIVIKQQPVTKAPRQKLVLQESQRKTPAKPINLQNNNVNRNAPVNQNASRNNSRPNSAISRPQSVVNNSNVVRNNNNNAPTNASELSRALQTANSIAITRSHPKQAEVVDLLRTHEKGWIDDRKFITLLKTLVF